MALTRDLRHFKLTEFKHPELVNPVAATYLDEVRHRYGRPLVLTDDARLPGEMPPGASPTSLHFKGQAFDLRIRDKSKEELWDLVAAVVDTNRWMPREHRGVLLELVWSARDKHCHIGFYLDGRPSRLMVAAD